MSIVEVEVRLISMEVLEAISIVELEAIAMAMEVAMEDAIEDAMDEAMLIESIFIFCKSYGICKTLRKILE